jgi:CBS domain-containing protein
MKAGDIMTRNVVSIDPDSTVLQAVRLMLQHRISGLPVVDKSGALVGIVTEGDFLRRAETATERKRPRWLEFIMGPGRLADEYVKSHARKVSEVMTPEPQTVSEDAPLEEVVQRMEKHRIKRLPVVRDKKLVGIVSRANLLHALASLAPSAPPPAASDGSIRDRLLTELSSQKWAPIGALNVMVRNGVVELWGTITDERERQALIVAAENIPGVKAVRDHLAWVEPTSGMVLYPPGEEPEGAAPQAGKPKTS